jgi:hypothetical protein
MRLLTTIFFLTGVVKNIILITVFNIEKRLFFVMTCKLSFRTAVKFQGIGLISETQKEKLHAVQSWPIVSRQKGYH